MVRFKSKFYPIDSSETKENDETGQDKKHQEPNAIKLFIDIIYECS
jgi:hypothetical protein